MGTAPPKTGSAMLRTNGTRRGGCPGAMTTRVASFGRRPNRASTTREEPCSISTSPGETSRGLPGPADFGVAALDLANSETLATGTRNNAAVNATNTEAGKTWPLRSECHGTEGAHRACRALARASSSRRDWRRLNRPPGPGCCSAAVTRTESSSGCAASTARAAATRSNGVVHALRSSKNAMFPTTTRCKPTTQPRSKPAIAPRTRSGNDSMDANAARPRMRPRAWRRAMRRATGRR